MDRRTTFICFCLMCTTVLLFAQPQAPVPLGGENEWYLLEFDNGAQWYFNGKALNAVHAIPAADAERLGYKTKLYGNGFTINTQLTLEDLAKRIGKEFKNGDAPQP